MFNKSMFNKVNAKKVLHKVHKNWVVVSLALLMAIGGSALASTGVSADSVNPNASHFTDATRVVNMQTNPNTNANITNTLGKRGNGKVNVSVNSTAKSNLAKRADKIDTPANQIATNTKELHNAGFNKSQEKAVESGAAQVSARNNSDIAMAKTESAYNSENQAESSAINSEEQSTDSSYNNAMSSAATSDHNAYINSVSASANSVLNSKGANSSAKDAANAALAGQNDAQSTASSDALSDAQSVMDDKNATSADQSSAMNVINSANNATLSSENASANANPAIQSTESAYDKEASNENQRIANEENSTNSSYANAMSSAATSAHNSYVSSVSSSAKSVLANPNATNSDDKAASVAMAAQSIETSEANSYSNSVAQANTQANVDNNVPSVAPTASSVSNDNPVDNSSAVSAPVFDNDFIPAPSAHVDPLVQSMENEGVNSSVASFAASLMTVNSPSEISSENSVSNKAASAKVNTDNKGSKADDNDLAEKNDLVNIKKPLLLHTSANFAKGSTLGVISPKNAALKVLGITKDHGYTRYIVSYKGTKGFITANKAYTRRAYIKAGRKNFKVRALSNIYVHTDKRFGRKNATKRIKKGTKVSVRKSVSFNGITRLAVKGGYITANTDLVF